MDLAKEKSHPLLYTYIIIVTIYKKTTKQQSQEREREREILEAFLLAERGVCLRMGVGAQRNSFYMPLLDIFLNYITKIQP